MNFRLNYRYVRWTIMMPFFPQMEDKFYVRIKAIVIFFFRISLLYPVTNPKRVWNPPNTPTYTNTFIIYGYFLHITFSLYSLLKSFDMNLFYIGYCHCRRWDLNYLFITESTIKISQRTGCGKYRHDGESIPILQQKIWWKEMPRNPRYIRRGRRDAAKRQDFQKGSNNVSAEL